MDENTAAAGTVPGITENETEKVPDDHQVFPQEKVFSQKELDEIVKNRLERAKKDIPSKEEINEFRQWKKERSDIEKKALDDIAAANSAKEAAEKEKNSLEMIVSCLSRGISPEYAEDVITLAKKYSENNIPIEAAVDRVIEKYPVFCGNSRGKIFHGITTGVRTRSGSDGDLSGKTNFIEVIKENQVRRK